MKNKKLVMAIAIIVIIIIIGIVIYISIQKNKDGNEEPIKTSQVYEKVSEATQITFTRTLDEDNKITIAIKDNKAYKEETVNGITSKYIVKDGNTYYLDEENNIYYIYQNNELILTEIKDKLNMLRESNSEKISGKEKVKGRIYYYEEFTGYQDLLINENMAFRNENEAKTRLYYSNNKLKYIKTMKGDTEEILKVDLSYNDIDEANFQIPDGYTEG